MLKTAVWEDLLPENTVQERREEADPAAAAVLTRAPYTGQPQVSDANRRQPRAAHPDRPAWPRSSQAIGCEGLPAAECRPVGGPAEAVRSIPSVPAFPRRFRA